MADKDGQRARLDMMVGQKLYFLSIEPPPPEIDSPVLPETETKPFSFSDFAKALPVRYDPRKIKLNIYRQSPIY